MSSRRQRKKKNCPYIQLKKFKPSEVALFIMDTDDENFDLSLSVRYVEEIIKNKVFGESGIILMPKFLNVRSLNKELFRECLDQAEEVYKQM